MVTAAIMVGNGHTGLIVKLQTVGVILIADGCLSLSELAACAGSSDSRVRLQ